MFTILRRIEPDENINRWYVVSVQPSLIDSVSMVIAYGNARNAWQKLRVVPVDNYSEAEDQAQQLIDKKVARGYVIVHQGSPVVLVGK